MDAKAVIAADHDCDARWLGVLLESLVVDPDSVVGTDDDRFDHAHWAPSTGSVEIVTACDLPERLRGASRGDQAVVVIRGPRLAARACPSCGAVLDPGTEAGPDLAQWTRALRQLALVVDEAPSSTVVDVEQLEGDPAPLALGLARRLGLPGSGDRLALARLRVAAARLGRPEPAARRGDARSRPVAEALTELARRLLADAFVPQRALPLPPCPPSLRATRGDVGIVIPTHEDVSLALDALASLLLEDEVDVQAVVADDGSASPAAVSTLAELDHLGYRVLRLDPSTVQAARNAGARQLETAALVFLDADDLLRPGFVAKAMRALLDTGAAVVFGDAAHFGQERGRWRTGPADPVTFLVGNRVPVTALVRAEDFWAAGGFDETLPSGGLEDWDLWLRIVEHGGAFVHLDQVAFDHRVREGSATTHWSDPERRRKVVARIAEAHRGLYEAHLGEMVALADWELRARLEALVEAKATPTGSARPLT